MPHFRGEPPALHPAFAPTGPASVLAQAEGPVPFDSPRIVYSEEDERALEEFARAQGVLFLLFCFPYLHSFSYFFVPAERGHVLALGELLLLYKLQSDRDNHVHLTGAFGFAVMH